MEKMIVKAFKKWCRGRGRPGCQLIVMDAMTFFLSLGAHGDEWPKVRNVLKKRGLIK